MQAVCPHPLTTPVAASAGSGSMPAPASTNGMPGGQPERQRRNGGGTAERTTAGQRHGPVAAAAPRHGSRKPYRTGLAAAARRKSATAESGTHSGQRPDGSGTGRNQAAGSGAADACTADRSGTGLADRRRRTAATPEGGRRRHAGTPRSPSDPAYNDTGDLVALENRRPPGNARRGQNPSVVVGRDETSTDTRPGISDRPATRDGPGVQAYGKRPRPDPRARCRRRPGDGRAARSAATGRHCRRTRRRGDGRAEIGIHWA
jgi:hypothetical protein